MPDPSLHGNGTDCPACEGSGAVATEPDGTRRCPICRGAGRLARPLEQIVADHVREARLHYWPEVDRRAKKERHHG